MAFPSGGPCEVTRAHCAFSATACGLAPPGLSRELRASSPRLFQVLLHPAPDPLLTVCPTLKTVSPPHVLCSSFCQFSWHVTIDMDQPLNTSVLVADLLISRELSFYTLPNALRDFVICRNSTASRVKDPNCVPDSSSWGHTGSLPTSTPPLSTSPSWPCPDSRVPHLSPFFHCSFLLSFLRYFSSKFITMNDFSNPPFRFLVS